jgi:acyl-coenzyme A thioesterase PaaI-like protein
MNPDRHPELHQVLRGLASNREPGWNFPANFLELSFDEVTQDSARLSLEPGGHCIDVDGQVNLAAICVLADIGMGVSMRRQLTVAGRSATVSMSLQFTGAARIGRLNLQGKLEGFVQRSVATQGLTRALIFAGDTLLCSASGTFVALENREGLAPLPMRGREDYAAVCALHPSELTDGELAVYTRAKLAAESMDDGSRSSGKPSVDSFIERFWSLLPQRTDGGAVCHFDNGLHVGNRVGHTQGGITFALAACTSNAALGERWQLVGASASYVSPGTGVLLRAEARIVHQGRLTAVAHTEVRDSAGQLVMDAVTNHSRVA